MVFDDPLGIYSFTVLIRNALDLKVEVKQSWPGVAQRVPGS
jgi:hypothetical protein